MGGKQKLSNIEQTRCREFTYSGNIGGPDRKLWLNFHPPWRAKCKSLDGMLSVEVLDCPDHRPGVKRSPPMERLD